MHFEEKFFLPFMYAYLGDKKFIVWHWAAGIVMVDGISAIQKVVTNAATAS